MCRCKIEWVDSQGNPTPDENPSVGTARIEFYSSGETREFPICAEHLKKMPQGDTYNRQGQRVSRWTFIPH